MQCAGELHAATALSDWVLLPQWHAVCNSISMPIRHIQQRHRVAKYRTMHLLLWRAVLQRCWIDAAERKLLARILLHPRCLDTNPHRWPHRQPVACRLLLWQWQCVPCSLSTRDVWCIEWDVVYWRLLWVSGWTVLQFCRAFSTRRTLHWWFLLSKQHRISFIGMFIWLSMSQWQCDANELSLGVVPRQCWEARLQALSCRILLRFG